MDGGAYLRVSCYCWGWETADGHGHEEEEETPISAPFKHPKRPRNYLDEVLAHRAAKKQKKKTIGKTGSNTA